jgi:hypothetical protein
MSYFQHWFKIHFLFCLYETKWVFCRLLNILLFKFTCLAYANVLLYVSPALSINLKPVNDSSSILNIGFSCLFVNSKFSLRLRIPNPILISVLPVSSRTDPQAPETDKNFVRTSELHTIRSTATVLQNFIFLDISSLGYFLPCCIYVWN